MTKKLTNRQINALETKDALYQAAISLFIEKGYEHVHIEDITSAANTAKGTFYIYFSSKKDLLYHTFNKFDEIYANAYKNVETLPTFEERLLAFIEQSYHQIDITGKEIPKALYHMNILEKEPRVTSSQRPLYLYIKKLIEFGMAAGELNPNYSVDYYLKHIKNSIVGLDYCWCVTQEKTDFAKDARECMAVLIKGLKNL